MKVVLRKEDSSTSNLLFIYNVVHSRDQRNSFMLSSLLEIMGKFGKAESATRMALSRACKAGILQTNKSEGDVIYVLTSDALQFIQAWNTNARFCWKRMELRNSPWENNWHLIQGWLSDQAKKGELNSRLLQVGYVQIGSQTWISPYHLKEEAQAIQKELDVASKILSVYGELEIGMESDIFLEETFELRQLENQYSGFICKYQPVLDQLRGTDAIISEEKALQMLHKLGFSYFQIANADPMLPKKLLPQWAGDEAASLMKELRNILENAVWDYLKDFN